MTDFGARVKFLRESQKLNQTTFAKKAGVNRTYVSGVETNKVDPSRNFLQAIHDTFGVGYDWLFTGEGEMFVGDKSEGQLSVMTSDHSVANVNGTLNAPVTITTTPGPPAGEGQGIVFERGEGPGKVRMILPPTPETYAFVREQWALTGGEYKHSSKPQEDGAAKSE